QGNLRCGPGARATPFEEARAADELQHTNLVRDGGAGAGAAAGAAGDGMTAGGSGGRNSPTLSSSSGRSSPAVECAMVPAVGPKLTRELGGYTAPELERHTDATLTQANLFLNEGFTYGQLDRKLAVKLLSVMLVKHHNCNILDWETVEMTTARWRDERSDDEDDDGYLLVVPGITSETMHNVQRHYGMEAGEDGPARLFYAQGWPEAEKPTSEKFAEEARLLAEDCLPGCALAAEEGPGARARPTGGGPSRQAHGGQGDGNRGRRTRRSTSKAAEDGLDTLVWNPEECSTFLVHVSVVPCLSQASKMCQKDFKHDQDARDAERRHQEHLVEKHRKEDKLERDTVRAAEKAERDAERASEESKRAFDLKMMEMRIQ
ncbi:unnamed protein product, partial [Pylaiella littoralis]